MKHHQSRSPTFYQNGCDWLQLNGAALLPTGTGTYHVRMLRNGKNLSPSLGIFVAPPPFNGRIVQITETFAVLQERPDCFTVIDGKMLGPKPPALHTHISLTPYMARDFDGISLYELPAAQRNGNKELIGKRRCAPPVDATMDILRNLLTQLTELPAPDGVRSNSEVLVDAGARRAGITLTEDPSLLRYSISFDVASAIGDADKNLDWFYAVSPRLSRWPSSTSARTDQRPQLDGVLLLSRLRAPRFLNRPRLVICFLGSVVRKRPAIPS